MAYHAELIATKLTKPEHYASVVCAAIFISTACRPDITQTIGRVSMGSTGTPGRRE